MVATTTIMHKYKLMTSATKLEGDSKLMAEGETQGFDYSKDPSLDNDIEPVCFLRMFRFVDKLDVVCLILGLACAMGNGVALMFYTNPYGQLTEAFAPNADRNYIVAQTLSSMWGFLKNAGVVFLTSWIMSASWAVSSERQTIKCRKEYLKALLRQEPSWHDRQRSTELAEKMYNETNKLQLAIGSKISSFLMSGSMIVGGLVIALTRGWKMAIVLMSFIPVMLVAGIISTVINKKADNVTNKIANRMAGNGLEVLESIRTVKALGGEQYEAARYRRTADLLEHKTISFSVGRELIGSLCYFCIIMNYTLGFWYGSLLVSRG